MIRKNLYELWLKVQGGDFKTQGKEIAQLEKFEDLQRFQEKYLKTMLVHAFENVPFYKEILTADVMADDQSSIFNRLENIPFLNKEIIRTQKLRLASKNYTSGKWYYNSSGGSSGEPVRFIQDSLVEKWRKATLEYYYKEIVGIDEIGVKKALLWGSERDLFEGSIGIRAKIINCLANTKLLNSFRMSKSDMHNFVNQINAFKPDLVRGYASSLFEFCNFVEANKLFIYSPCVVISSAERLETEKRKKIEKVFKAKVFNFYGSREVNAIAGECKFGKMHIFSFNNYIEILDKHNKPANQGEIGRVVVTTLHNYSMPLIRYEIGDTAIIGRKGCKCGNPLPTLEEIAGRVTDHFLRKDGTVIHGEYFTHLFYLRDWVRAFQVIQEDYDKVKILIAVNNPPTESEKREIEQKILLLMGSSSTISWSFVQEIPRTSSGKYLYTKSLVTRK
jgi:phenylacetate-CoA ligase